MTNKAIDDLLKYLNGPYVCLNEQFARSDSSSLGNNWTTLSCNGYAPTITSQVAKVYYYNCQSSGQFYRTTENYTKGNYNISGQFYFDGTGDYWMRSTGINLFGSTSTSLWTAKTGLTVLFGAASSCWDPDAIRVYSGTTLLATYNFGLSTNTWYSYRVKYINGVCYVRLWLSSGSEPSTWQITQTADANYTSNSFSVLYWMSGSGGYCGDWYFDNINIIKNAV